MGVDSTNSLERKVIRVASPRPAFGRPLGPAILKIADQFLLLRIDRKNWLPICQIRLGLRVDVLKLGIAIWVGSPFQGLAIGLQAITELGEKLADELMGDLVTLLAQLLGQLAHTLA